MKRTTAVFSALMAAMIFLSLTGCSGQKWRDRLRELKDELSSGLSESNISDSDQEDKPATIDILLEALDNKDSEQFKSVFSKKTLTLADDMDKGVAYIFSLYEGEYARTVYHNYSSDKHYGDKNTTLINAIYVIQTTADKYYRICYSIWTVQEKDPDSLGIYSLDFCECDKDQMGGGGGSWLAGITYPEREGAENVAGDIASTMITGDAKYLRSVLSDRLLATQDTDKKVTAFTADYSTINSSTVGDSWVRVRQDGTFVYLMVNTRPRTFIVAKMSREQPDKMDGMKVTIVPVDESIPQQGIEPEGIGLDFPKFPHPKASSSPQ